MASLEIVSTNIQVYKPVYDEETGLYKDECPYKKYSRCQNLIYTCPCISGCSLNRRQQFLQHFNTKAHTNWRENLGKDENIKLIKELRIADGKKENLLRIANTKIKLQARRLQIELTKNNSLKESIKNKDTYIKDLENNIKLLEETSGLCVEESECEIIGN
tara:strand:+ start:87 stop:569 length:483 start_codon:yes stop_codon:yes gene_type:complete